MTLNEILELISQNGFPIVCCCYLFWERTKTTALHKEESDRWVQSLNSNTLVMQKLLDKFDKES